MNESRIFRFRVFNSRTLKMNLVTKLEFAATYRGFKFDSDFFIMEVEDESKNTLKFGYDKFVVMQSTGLIDKNKNEIYEGDIVLWRYQTGHDYTKDPAVPIYSAEYILGIVYYQVDNYQCGFQLRQISNGKFSFEDPIIPGDTYSLHFYGYDGHEFLWCDLEVVGNIYELQFSNSEIEEKVKTYLNSEAGKKNQEISDEEE